MPNQWTFISAFDPQDDEKLAERSADCLPTNGRWASCLGDTFLPCDQHYSLQPLHRPREISAVFILFEGELFRV